MTQAASGEGTEGASRKRWPRIALLISLALNVLFAGVFVGGAWIHWRDDGRGGRNVSFSRGVERLINELPADRKAIAQDALERYRADVRPRWKEVGEARREAFDAMRAEPFDEQRVQAAFNRLEEIRRSQRERLGTLTFDLMRQLTPEERRAFLQAMGPRRQPPPPPPPSGN